MKKPIQCGVVGAGCWATSEHIPALRGHPEPDLVVIQNPNPDKARAVVQDFGVPHAVGSFTEVLDCGLDGGGGRQLAQPALLSGEGGAAAAG